MERDHDHALMERLAAGETSALAALYDRHGRAAYGLALRVLRDAHLAEDAVQDAFLALWRSAGSFDPRRARASTWLHVLVHRRAVDLVRRQEHRRLREGAVPAEREPDGIDEPAIGDDERARVRAALTRLPDGQRVVVELAYYEGLTQREIAAQLDIPLGTVKSRSAAALTCLGTLLAEPDRRKVGACERLLSAAV